MREPTPREEAIAKKLAEPLHKYAITNGIFKNKNIKLGKMGGSFTIHLSMLEALRMAYVLKYKNKPTKKLLSMFEEMLEYINYRYPVEDENEKEKE
jgi:hypothetical protein|tara:strand:+ start:173 stop:460 length:288 start_codon:yes stop_codon:yes gene_type:complete